MRNYGQEIVAREWVETCPGVNRAHGLMQQTPAWGKGLDALARGRGEDETSRTVLENSP